MKAEFVSQRTSNTLSSSVTYLKFVAGETEITIEAIHDHYGIVLYSISFKEWKWPPEAASITLSVFNEEGRTTKSWVEKDADGGRYSFDKPVVFRHPYKDGKQPFEVELDFNKA